MEDKKIEEGEKEEIRARALLKSLLEQEAYERMSNIKISNPELYSRLVSIIISLAQRGQIKKKITEEQLKLLVSQILSQRKEGSILRISK
ncbi:MAG: DNA-binding protein [Candidatus Marsarchaeota archaeon]|nr:DNA-binding protein [Candidatus Marsarchaeota archaeon]